MVNEEPLANAGCGMNLNAGERAVHVRYDTRQHRHAAVPKRMGRPVEFPRVEARVREHHFQRIPSRRIAIERGLDVFANAV